MWPAFAAASASEIAALLARRFASLALGDADSPAPREPAWTTPNTIALELDTVPLRDFSIAKRQHGFFVVCTFSATWRGG